MVSSGNIAVLKELNTETLQLLKEMLSRIDQRLYTQVNAKGRASVGQHVRHTLEFYQCLFSAEDRVNYDTRKRDVLIESSSDHAANVIEDIIASIGETEADGRLELEAELPGSEDSLVVRSSLSRELLYVLEHAIHHMALIRVLIKDSAPEFDLDEAFGVAYSTLAYRDRQANG